MPVPVSEAAGTLVGTVVVQVAVDAPQHSGLAGALDYLSERPLSAGTLLRVPLGKRQMLGIVWRGAGQAAAGDHALRPVGDVFDGLPPMAPAWLALVDFAASDYQRGVGELALAVLPPVLRKLDAAGLALRLTRLLRKWDTPAKVPPTQPPTQPPTLPPETPALGPEQQVALDAFQTALAQPRPPPMLLHGVTGSGKTEVYLRATAQVPAPQCAAGHGATRITPQTGRARRRVRQGGVSPD